MVEKGFLLEGPWWLDIAMRTVNVILFDGGCFVCYVQLSDVFKTFCPLVCVCVALLTSVVSYGYVAVFSVIKTSSTKCAT